VRLSGLERAMQIVQLAAKDSAVVTMAALAVSM
jgi:hypothetical protein